MNEINITSAIKKLDVHSDEHIGYIVVIDGIEMSVPLDPANRHYAEILRQVEAGTLTISEAE